MQDHVLYLTQVFDIVKTNQLILNFAKCHFAITKVEYLGHFITNEGVSTGPAKVKAVYEWPASKTMKQLRGFLGLAGYYRRFVKDFGKIAKSRTNLLKKDSFEWTGSAVVAFQALKFFLTHAPMLTLAP